MKLTLYLDKDIVQRAREYAEKQGVSLSSLVENYLQSITADLDGETAKEGSIVDELSGIIRLDSGTKDDHIKYLNEKYK
ncbi:MAG: DUF6364 family protein [Bacteroidota bacterium]